MKVFPPKYVSTVLAVVALTVTSTPAQLVTALAGGTVSGTVLNRQNQPMANISVQVVKVVKKLGQADSGTADVLLQENEPENAGTSTTGPDGKFSIENIPPGRYRVIAGDQMSGSGTAWATVVEGKAVTVTIKVKTRFQ